MAADTTVPPSIAGSAPAVFGSGPALSRLERLVGLFLAERDRWVLWVPVFIGGGIAFYFALPFEPPSWAGAGLLFLAIVGGIFFRNSGPRLLLACTVALFGLGMAAAQIETLRVRAPILQERVGPAYIEGRLVEIDPFPLACRLVIEPSRIPGLEAERLPARIRIRVKECSDSLAPGLRLSVRAILYPPPAPAMPGAYDFQRRAFFDRLGGVGFSVGPVTVLGAAAGEGASGWRQDLAALRDRMTQRIRAVLPGTTGGVAAAIITGETHAIPEADADAFRDAGLAHILVIAGLHMGMLAGIVFGGLRAGFALIPALALRYPIKKWAAGLALLMSLGYMLLSGMTVSSRRAFVMTGLVFLAILVDRHPFSTRSLALAAIIVMLATPVAVTGPSFQMSFAAVAGLLAFYETFQQHLASMHHQAGLLRKGVLYGFGISLTTILCTVATAPYTIYHFNRFAVFSVAANIVAVPITGFWVMPFAILACLLMPLGLEVLALVPMGWGVDVILLIARTVTAWPNAAVDVPAMPFWGLFLITSGGLWLCIWRRAWRLLGLAPIFLGFTSLLLTSPPDLIIADDGKLVALRAADRSYMLSGRPRGHLNAEVWLRRAAAVEGEHWPRDGDSRDGRLHCASGLCRYEAGGHVVIVVRGKDAPTDCSAELVVGPLTEAGNCRAATQVIDETDLSRNGAYAVWLGTGAVRIESVADERGTRPWVPGGDPGSEEQP
jgi:competence protein ComEC